ncbi:MAG: UbiA family prenyltransferase, partial [Bacteroidota bacterium]
MSKVKSYLSLIKFSHTIFAMPFAMIGFALGLLYVENTIGILSGWGSRLLSQQDDNTELIRNHLPGTYYEVLVRFILVVLCMVFARSAAMAFNRYLDRQFDAKNPRTTIREIPAGIISEKNALLFTILSSL